MPLPLIPKLIPNKPGLNTGGCQLCCLVKPTPVLLHLLMSLALLAI